MKTHASIVLPPTELDLSQAHSLPQTIDYRSAVPTSPAETLAEKVMTMLGEQAERVKAILKQHVAQTDSNLEELVNQVNGALKIHRDRITVLEGALVGLSKLILVTNLTDEQLEDYKNVIAVFLTEQAAKNAQEESANTSG
jgi:cytosine/adenosine deaminase-related metal-dependent hydrolase